MDPSASSKTCWSILITFLKGKKIPCITPIFHENKLFTDLKGTEIFNIIFSNQYKILENANQTHLNSSIHHRLITFRHKLYKLRNFKNISKSRSHQTSWSQYDQYSNVTSMWIHYL